MMTAPKIDIRRVATEEILDLRHRILRAGLPPESARFDGDDAATTFHFAAFAMDDSHGGCGRLAACLSMMLNSFEGRPAWQLRGMAVEDSRQRAGLGRTLLTHAENVVTAENKAGLLWCNARMPAAGFYQCLGWAVVSDVFEIPTAGPHVKMSKSLKWANQPESVENRLGAR